MIWLDGLDLPQFRHFPVHFAQHYSEPRYPAVDAPKSPILFPWSEMEDQLEKAIRITPGHAVVRYTSQEKGQEGQEVSLRLGAQCEKLEAGCTSKTVRETASSVYHIIDGKGRTIIGESVISWVKGDTFSVPSWQPYRHEVSNAAFDPNAS
jgi:gentisate 1,2-dioxygenase